MSAACCGRASWPRPAPRTRPGTLSAEALRAVEDRCIAAAIRQQEEIGLRAATDGEYRRAYWHYDFVSGLDGVELYEPEQKIQFKGGLPLPHALRVTGPIGWSKPVMVDDYRFVAGHVRTAVPKMTIPSPSRGAFPRRAAGDRSRRPIRTWTGSSPIWARRTTRRWRRSARPGAAICSSTR